MVKGGESGEKNVGPYTEWDEIRYYSAFKREILCIT